MEKYSKLPAGHPDKDAALEEWRTKNVKNTWGSYNSSYRRSHEEEDLKKIGYGTKYFAFVSNLLFSATQKDFVNSFVVSNYIIRTHMRYDLAKVLNIPQFETCPSQKKVLEGVMKKLEDQKFADDDWEETNLVQQSYKEQKLRRFRTTHFH